MSVLKWLTKILSELEYQPVMEMKFSDDDEIVLRELHSRLFKKASSCITLPFILFVKLGQKIDFFFFFSGG